VTNSSFVHSCNAYCRPPFHADIVYTTWSWDERGAAGPKGFVALDVERAMRRHWPFVRVRDARPAPEALPVEKARRIPGYGYLRRGEAEPSAAWLVVWEEVTM
jgi:hypothetical protein